MPAFLSKAEKQFSTNGANQTRFITKIRWVVESANGRIKTWRSFDRVLPNSMMLIAGDLFSIVCALINAFRPLFVRNISNDDVLADKMLSLINESNKLKESIDTLKVNGTKNLNWTRIDASNTFRDFSVLTLDQFNEITLGWFQLKQEKRY